MKTPSQKLCHAVRQAAIQFGACNAVAACDTSESHTASQEAREAAAVGVEYYAARWNIR